MEKKYSNLTNKIQALKLKEMEMESRMSAMQKRSNQIEEIKKQKNDFKNEVKENKELKQRMLKEQKERIKNLRKFEQNRQETLKKMANQKKKLILEINKEDKNLYKTMLSQTHYKTEESKLIVKKSSQKNKAAKSGMTALN